MTIHTVALIGFGEVGQVLAADIKNARIKAFDLLRPAGCATATEAVTDADLVISAVTAAQTVAAAQSVTTGMKAGAWYMDLNSASPEAKGEAARIITEATGRFVEVAVMSPITPKRMASPMLLGGPYAESFAPLIQAFGFTGAEFYSEISGKAAATKLCRSVMIKGLEALISESLLSARYYGVEDTVLASLDNLFPHPDWQDYARYMISRTLEHGARRAEEMREAAKTVREAGLTPWMAEATANRQAWAPDYAEALRADGLKPMLDAMRSQLDSRKDATT